MEKIKKFISRRLIVILFFVLAGAVFLISARGEYLQYKEIGEQYVSIFFKNLRTKYIVFFVAFICSYLIIFVSKENYLYNTGSFSNNQRFVAPE